MTKRELGNKLRNLYDDVDSDEKITMIHLFGIKYGEIIKTNGYDFREIAEEAGISETYEIEISKGANLAKHVTLK